MSQAMTRTQIYIEPDDLAQAKLKAKSDGFNLSQYFRKLLKDDIKNQPTEPNIKDKKIIPIRVLSPKSRKTIFASRDHNIIYDHKL